MQDLRFTDPVRLVVLYRLLAGLDDLEPLPPGASYASIIQTIIEYEADKQEGTRPCPVAESAKAARHTFTLNEPPITLIEHLPSAPISHATRHKPTASADVPIANEVFGPIDIYDEGIDGVAAARFTLGNVR